MKRIVLLTIFILVLSLTSCASGKKEKGAAAVAATVSSNSKAVSANAFALPPDEEKKQEAADELAASLIEGYDLLVETRDLLYAYYHDDTIANNEEIARGIIMADELIAKIAELDKSKLKTFQVAGIFDEISDVMDVFSSIKPAQDPKSIDILNLKESLKGSMWIDDDINTYIFDRDGETMYIALAGDDEPVPGKYEVGFTEDSIRFTFSIPELTTEVKGDVTQFTEDAFKFTDVNTGDVFYLTPVDR